MKVRIDHLKIKVQLLKFSYTSLKNFYERAMFVFTTRDCHQIFRAIIISDTVNMVNYPPFGQCFIMSLFPNKKMFSYITKWVGSRMSLFKNKYISSVIPFTTIPLMMCCPHRSIPEKRLGIQLVTQSQTFRCGSMRQSTLYKQLAYCTTLARMRGITKAKRDIIQTHVLIPMKVKQFFTIYKLRNVYSLRHIISIAYNQSNGKSILEFIYAH